GGLRTVTPPMVGRQPPPGALEVDEDLTDVEARGAERIGDRRARDDRHVVLRGGTAEQDGDRWVAVQSVDAHAPSSRGQGQPDHSPTNSTSGTSSRPVPSPTTDSTWSTR